MPLRHEIQQLSELEDDAPPRIAHMLSLYMDMFIPIVKYMPGREIDVPSNVLDIRLIEDNIGWYPKRNLEKSIKQTSDWMQESL